MNTLVLGLSFATTTVVSGMIVLAFSTAIDDILLRLTSMELAPAWSRCVKFAIFAASFTGGLRLNELETLTAIKTAGLQPLDANQGLLEVFKSLSATVSSSAWALLIFFGCALVAYAVLRVYETYKPAASQPRSGDRHSGSLAGRV